MAVPHYKTLLIAALVAALAHAHHVALASRPARAALLSDFERFEYDFGKRYGSAEERAYRMGVFYANVAEIEATNAKNLGFYSEVNAFADMTWDEFQHAYLMTPQNECSATTGGPRRASSVPLPKSVDWRSKGIVSAVKNQGHCGSCWTFSTTGALEAAYNMAAGMKNTNISLSEQQLVDCAQAFDNHGCSGGLPSHAFEYGESIALRTPHSINRYVRLTPSAAPTLPVMYNGGLDTEEAYPYEGKNGSSCRYKPKNAGVHVEGVVNITRYDERELVEAVGLIKPVSVAFQVAKDFRFYKSGTYTSKECESTPQSVNHAVLAVGYSLDAYWIIKNSWGTDWGMDGYFHMGPVGHNMCGISTCASYPLVSKTIPST